MPFEKGKSGNPKGRPKKGQTITDLLDKYLNKSIEIEILSTDSEEDIKKKKVKRKQLLIEKAFEMAINGDGDLNAIKYIVDRIDGKPHQTIDTDITTDGEPLTQINIVGVSNEEGK